MKCKQKNKISISVTLRKKAEKKTPKNSIKGTWPSPQIRRVVAMPISIDSEKQL